MTGGLGCSDAASQSQPGAGAPVLGPPAFARPAIPATNGIAAFEHVRVVSGRIGSMLGGRVIARQLDHMVGPGPDGRRFFIARPSDEENWSQLLAVLEEACDSPPALGAAICGSNRTFDWFEECVIRRSPG